jgi:preprotein translocase subunit SecD
VRVVRATGILAACAALASSCGSSPHSTLVLKTEGAANTQELDQTAAVLRRRLALLGPQHASVSAGPRGRITVTTRNALTPEQRRALMQRGSFAIYDLEADLAPESMNGFTVRASTHKLAAGPETTAVRCDLGRDCPGAPANGSAKTYWYLFQSYPGRNADPIPELTASDLRRSAIHPAGGGIALGLTSEGARSFREITQTEAARGQALSRAQHFAIVLDGALVSTPSVDYKEFPNGIDTKPGVELVGAPKDLAVVLRSGELPLRLAVAR